MKIDIGLWNKQLKFMSMDCREILLECGIGYGKTFVGSIWSCTMILKNPNKIGMIVARDFGQFKKAVLPELTKAFQLFGWREGKHYKFNKVDNIMEFWNGAKVFVASALNYDSSFRGPNVAWIWADEVDFYKPIAFQTMLGRLRVKPELLRCTSSPKGFNHIYDHFYTQANETKLVLNASTWENLNLSQSYIDSLRGSYSPRMFEQECGAVRLNLNNGAVFNEFNRELHVAPCAHLIKPTDQLYFFTDYNISNYCGTYMFYDKEKDISYAIAEEHLKFEGSRIMAQRVKAKYPERPIIVMGDSTGNNKRDVAIDRTNYQHFQDAGLLTKHFTNPPVESRIISANSNLYHSRCVVDPSCKNLIKDLELLAWREDGEGVDKSNIDLSHASDGWSYGDWYFHGVGKPKQKVGFTVSSY